MRKLLFAILVCLIAPTSIFAGGIVTNTNQSASFIRLLVRDASLGLDAVYYNPAATALFKDGFHISLNNQTVLQARTIDATNLNRTTFEGKINAPLFPSVFYDL